MNENVMNEAAEIYAPTFDELLLDLLRMSETQSAQTADMIARLERGESLWLTLF